MILLHLILVVSVIAAKALTDISRHTPVTQGNALQNWQNISIVPDLMFKEDVLRTYMYMSVDIYSLP